jgi:hypothetical protein
MTIRIAFVSCTKAKAPTAAAARDLYVSPLFRALRSYAERHSDRWYVLSALHGIIEPNTIIEPYDVTLNRMSRADRMAWWKLVRSQLPAVITEPAEVTLLAGMRYREMLEPHLKREMHCEVNVPLHGRRLGEQLAWLKREAADGES